jgi:predicted metalloprotease
MRWTPGGRSRNIEDRRGRAVGMGGRGLPFGVGGLLIILVLSYLTGTNPLELLGPMIDQVAVPSSPGGGISPENLAKDEPLVEFMSFVLDDAQETWAKHLGSRYSEAQLVLFTDAVQSACGFGESATGPFYCPGDRKVYLDLGFFKELQNRFGAAGDFAQAYVLAHEIGHHVQTVTGTEGRVRQLQQQSPGDANQLSVRMELQADCYAGIWGNATARRDVLEQGDVEEALTAAASIGDDRLQRMQTGVVQPDRFTHGSSAQRVEWFRRGLQSGDPAACDTFNTR